MNRVRIFSVLLMSLCLCSSCTDADWSQLDPSKMSGATNTTGEKMGWFVEAFMPGVDPNDVLTLNYVRGGGREAPFLAVATFTSNGISALRQGTERTGISHMRDARGVASTFTNNRVNHSFAAKVISNLSAKVTWWTMDDAMPHEQRSIQWMGDHSAKFFIPTNETPVYIEAIVH